MWLLRSRRSFRHQGWPNWLMSYFYVLCVIRHNMTFYVIWRIWHGNMTQVNLADISVWTTVWTSAITHVHPIWAKKLFKNAKNKKMRWKFFPFINFENPLYFWLNFQLTSHIFWNGVWLVAFAFYLHLFASLSMSI